VSDFTKPDDWPEAVVVLSKDPWSVAGYAPHIEPKEPPDLHQVIWREAHHDRIFPISEVHEQSADVFDFSSGGVRFRLLPMTLELFERHVRPRTMGEPHFGSLQQLLDVMRTEW
jgi:hypothetical protein